MGFCTKCGKELAQNAQFCTGCGVKLSDETQSALYNAEPTQYKAPEQTFVMSPAVMALKKIGSSPLFLVVAIIFSLNIVFGFTSGVNSLVPMFLNSSAVRELIWELNIEMSAFYSMIYGGGIIGRIVASIPSVIIAVGFWLIYATCSDKKSPYIKTSGFTMVKVISVINLVVTCIGAALVLIALLLAGIGLMASGAEEAGIAALVLFFVGIVVYAFAIVYQAKIVQSLNAAKTVALTGKPSLKVSGFVGVMCYISSITSIMSFIVSSFTVFRYLSVFVILRNMFSMILSVFMSIAFGVLIFKYRGEMKKLFYNL